MPLVVLQVGADGRVRLELPRLESGQGIATACGMMVAEELYVPLSSVDVTLSDARPELMFNQFTGGSATFGSSMRRCPSSPPLPRQDSSLPRPSNGACRPAVCPLAAVR